MAYKQTPGRGNQAKTGHGIPAPFKQTMMGTVGLGAGTSGGKFVTEKVKKTGEAISQAHKAGTAAYDKSIKGESYWGGSGAKRDYSKNPVEYAKGFASNLMSDSNTKTNEKKKSPAKQTKSAAKKEKGFLDTASDYASSAVSKVKGALKKGDDYLRKLEGPSGDSRYGDVGDTVLGVKLSGNKAGKKVSPAKMKNASPVKQMETINKVVSKAKEVGGKIAEGIKKMDKALEGKSDTRSFNAKDTVLGRRSTGARAGEKTSPAKMKMGKKAPAKMKKC